MKLFFSVGQITKASAARLLVKKLCITLTLTALSPALSAKVFAASAVIQFFAAPNPGAQCRAAIAQAERIGAIPAQLLAAIGRVESGRRDPVSGSFSPWPWTVNAEGKGYYFDSKAEAIAAVRKMNAEGVHSIDVGCLQVNLMHHPNAFTSLEAAFDPVQNATYAAKFLNDLHSQSVNWPKATALYHSANPELGEPYQNKVLAAWPDEKRLAGQSTPNNFAWGYGAPSPNTSNPRFGATGSGSPGSGASRLDRDGAGIAQVRRIGFNASDTQSDSPANTVIPNSIGQQGSGRSLDAYRAAPITAISRIRRVGG